MPNSEWRWLRTTLFDSYRPELHYMRGPGPKWREKHGAVLSSEGGERSASWSVLTDTRKLVIARSGPRIVGRLFRPMATISLISFRSRLAL